MSMAAAERNREARMRVAAPAWKFVIALLVLTVVCGIAGNFILAKLFYPAAALCVVLAFYVLYFFRDPGRRVPNIPGAFVSPADGKVVSIIEVPAEQMPGGRARRVAIFLNVFNVHIQRIAQAGTIRQVVRKQGKFINALNEKCSEENEQLTIWIDSDEGGMYGIRQIAGAIARRIVLWAGEGEHLDRGQRYGLIQFGSRVELFVPMEATIKVQPGQKVKGGESCIALLYEEEARKGRFPVKEPTADES